MNVLPGEPLPPGSEGDEVTQIAEIQKAIDSYKGNALIGLEYTIELHEDNREVNYLCVVCDKRSDPRTVMQHWTSYNHRLKYLEKHYPTAVRELNKVKHKPNGNSFMVIIVQSLAEAVEDHHGRLNPTALNADDFRRTKSKTLNAINAKQHHDEKSGPNFVDIVDRAVWKSQPPSSTVTPKLNLQVTSKSGMKRSNNDGGGMRDILDEVSSDSDEGSGKIKKKEQSPAYRIVPKNNSPGYDDHNTSSVKNLPTPKELSMQASLIAQERYKWEKYRCMLEIQLKQMVNNQREYEKNPEKHPLYPEEWKKFWNRRYKELQIEKKVDPNKYDYKPEWIAFWTVREKELFNIELEKKKKEIKASLNLPEDAEEQVDQLKEKYKVQVNNNSNKSKDSTASAGGNAKRINTNTRETHQSDIIDISDEELPVRQRRYEPRSRKSRSISPSHRSNEYKRSRRRESSPSLSPFSDDHERPSYGGQYEKVRHVLPPVGGPYYEPGIYGRSRFGISPPPPSSTRYAIPPGYRIKDPYALHPRHEHPGAHSAASAAVKKPTIVADNTPEPEDEGPLTVVAVLRLLTALEDHLGSLGPKVVDLLGKALALEKIKANSADELLMNEDNCVFFETVKEKLKGLLIAEVIQDQQKIRAVKRAIKNIAATMHQVNLKGANKAETTEDDANETNNVTTSSTAASNKKFKFKTRLPNTATDLPFDRQVIASKLAAALVKEGREDVSIEDMDKLIYFYILLVKLSKKKFDFDEEILKMKDIGRDLCIPILTGGGAGVVSVVKPKIQSTAIVNIPAATSKPPVLPVSTITSAFSGIVDQLFESSINAFNNTRGTTNDIDDHSNDMADSRDASKSNESNSASLESLTDSDLQTLLQNFKHLSAEEQDHLIRHLKKLERAEPVRYTKLRKYINMADLDDTSLQLLSEGTQFIDDDNASSTANHSRKRNVHLDDSPLSKRSKAVNISNPNKFSLDDEDDDDYNFDDVLRAATTNVDSNSRNSRSTRNTSITPDRNSLSSRPNVKLTIADTENLIENIMVSLNQKSKTVGNASVSSNGAPSHNNQSEIKHPPMSQQERQSMPTQAGGVGQGAGVSGPPMPSHSQPPYQPQQAQHYAQQQGYQQQPQQQPQQSYQQHGFPVSGGPGYNQMGGQWDNSAYYNNNAMGGVPPNYNANVGYSGYPNQQQQWGNAQQMPQFGGFMHPNQQQMGYNNMYGGN